ncbi:MAG TPA: Uma2 family endonuclease [Verrucomicrobiae bacterium]
MTAAAKQIDWITPDEYLEGELTSLVRHEYVSGQVFAMAGASDDHNRIAGNLFADLHAHLRGKRCEAFMNDMKVRAPENDAYYYPDVIVGCDPSDNNRYFRERPSHIFEVISPETEMIDRREKMAAYSKIAGIKTYVLLEQDSIRATVTRWTGSGPATEVVEGLEGILKLPDIALEIPLSRIYERTTVARKQ